jgi:hypothetical protein
MSSRNYVINNLPYSKTTRQASIVYGDKVTPYAYSMDFIERFYDAYQLPFMSSPRYGDMGLPDLLQVPTSVISNVQIANVLKASQKLKDSSFNASIFLAEGRDTITLLANTVSRLASAVVYLRRGDILRSARELGVGVTRRQHKRIKNLHIDDEKRGIIRDPSKGVSNAWLELQFGWKPLVSDIETGAEALANLQFRPKTMSAKASNRSSLLPEASGFHDRSEYQSGHAIWTQSVRYQSGIGVTIASPVNTIGNLALDTPYTAFWNAVPWSFLWDYVMPVGAYLEAKESANKLDVSSYYIWKKTTNIAVGVWADSFGAPFTLPAFYKQVNFTRSILPNNSFKDLPLPRIKPVKSIFSTTHVLNSLALLRGAFK